MTPQAPSMGFKDMDYRTQMQVLAVMIAVGTPEQRREAIDFLKLRTPPKTVGRDEAIAEPEMFPPHL